MEGVCGVHNYHYYWICPFCDEAWIYIGKLNNSMQSYNAGINGQDNPAITKEEDDAYNYGICLGASIKHKRG